MAGPGSRRRVDRRGESRHARRREGRRPGRGRREPGQPGAQSFQPDSLRVLERNHGRAEVEQAVEIVRPRFPRWSLDLIFGVPGSTLDDWRADLEIALGIRPRRISRATGWSTRRGRRSGSSSRAARSGRSTRRSSGRCTRPRSSGSAAPGLAMYEISNFARPGHESRHNLVYWANDAYFGFGVGAARYVRGVRSVNTRELSALPAADRGRRAGDRADRGADPEERRARPPS